MPARFLILSIAVLLVSGCTSISKGVTQAIIEREQVDERQCWIAGRPFEGLGDVIATGAESDPDKSLPTKLKIMSVHGIGKHAPGYARRLLDGVVEEFGFITKDEEIKTINLLHPEYEEGLGVLTVHRYTNPNDAREILFYELTWDPIVEQEIKIVSYDDSIEFSSKRTPFNHSMKSFINETVPDALMYNTPYRIPIQTSLGNSLCWMFSESWEDLATVESRFCQNDQDNLWSQVNDSSIAILSHSLGSRISIDALELVLKQIHNHPERQALEDKLKDKPIYLYMLSNQLPLLQVGQPLPEVYDQTARYCRTDGDLYDQRFFKKLQVVAFSDPNDLFSYAVQPAFINRHMDSRLCPVVTNVMIEVAHVARLFGDRGIASPQKAHTEYEADSRVLKMLVSGFGPEHGHEEVRERCEFLELVPGEGQF